MHATSSISATTQNAPISTTTATPDVSKHQARLAKRRVRDRARRERRRASNHATTATAAAADKIIVPPPQPTTTTTTIPDDKPITSVPVMPVATTKKRQKSTRRVTTVTSITTGFDDDVLTQTTKEKVIEIAEREPAPMSTTVPITQDTGDTKTRHPQSKPVSSSPSSLPQSRSRSPPPSTTADVVSPAEPIVPVLLDQDRRIVFGSMVATTTSTFTPTSAVDDDANSTASVSTYSGKFTPTAETLFTPTI